MCVRGVLDIDSRWRLSNAILSGSMCSLKLDLKGERFKFQSVKSVKCQSRQNDVIYFLGDLWASG